MERVNDFENDNLTDILSHMLRIDPRERYNAKQCLETERGCRNGLFRRPRYGLIVNTCGDSDDKTTVRAANSNDAT